MLSDGKDKTFGELQALLKFNLSALPSSPVVESALLELNVTNPSGGSYQVFRVNRDWQESSVTWATAGSNGGYGELIASFSPESKGVIQVDLTASGVLERWMETENHGLVIVSNGTNDGLDFSSRELGGGPVLKVKYR